MNWYVFIRPFNKVKRDRKIYAVVFIQLVVAFSILSIFLSLLLDIAENKKQMIQESRHKNYQITVQASDFEYEKFDLISWGSQPATLHEYDNFPFSEKVLNQIHNTCIQCEPEVCVDIELLYLGELIEENQSLHLYYSTEYEKVSFNKKTEEILLDINNENTINPRDFPHTISNDVLLGMDGEEYPIEYMESNELAVYMPIALYESIYHPKDLKGTVLNIKSNTEKMLTTETVNQVLSLLRENCGQNYQFMLGSDFARFLVQVEEAEREAIVLIFVSCIMFLIVLIGMIGIFIMILKRREKEIAICCALGQTKRQICYEIFGEVCILNISSCIVGILSGWLLIKNGISVATVEVTFHAFSCISLFLVACLFSIIVVIPMKVLIEKASPIQILSSL
ncbi:MAG: ABC transporter permease [Roseburia sp.]|nr:ABC transporter permease [Roseburia sp.]MCM1279012.1 ABC transporter permease [Robinsoniella sp.]